MATTEITEEEKIRILHITYSLSGGGAERQLRHLVNALNSQQFTNAVCCADIVGSEQFSSQVRLFNIPRKSKLDLRWRPIAQLIEQWQPDIIHNWLPTVLWSSLVPARLKKIKYIGSYRNVYQLSSLKRLSQALGFLFADTIVSNVHVQEQLWPFNSMFELKAGQFIPNGIDLEKIRTAPSVAMNRPDVVLASPTLLYVGRLAPHKNIELVLEAVAKLKAQAVTASFLICGHGPDERRLKELVTSLGIQEQVRFLGYRTDVYAIMHKSDLFVLPSLWEGMPNVLFEAMAANLPVLASDIPVHRRWLENGSVGLLFDPTDSEQLATCLAQALTETNHDRKKRLENARRLVEKLSIAQMAASYGDFYTALVCK